MTETGCPFPNRPRFPPGWTDLVREAVFGDAETKPAGRWIIGETAQALGIRPASIHELYLAEGRAGDPPDSPCRP